MQRLLMFAALCGVIAVTATTAATGLTHGALAPQDSSRAETVAVDLNTASPAELEALPGIGARTAQLIVEYRDQRGGFKKIEELMNVRGIGEKTFLRLRPLVRVSEPAKR